MVNVFGTSTSGELRTHPWARREVGGVYVGYDGSVWLYRQLPLAPLQHEDAELRLSTGRVLEDLLEEVGSLSRDIGQGMSLLSQNRSVHLFAVTYDELNTPPTGTPAALEPLFDQLLAPVVTAKALLVGVKLRSSLIATSSQAKGLKGKLKAFLPTPGDQSVSLDGFASDFSEVDAILRRNGATAPTPRALEQLESWWTNGQGPDAVVEYLDDQLHVPSVGRKLQIRAVMELPKTLSAPYAQWLLDAMCHPAPAVAVSLRAELEPATVTRSRLRHQRRKLIAQEQEEQATGDLARDENSSKLQYAQDLESYVVAARTPWLTTTSVLLAGDAGDGVHDTYAQMLASQYGIATQPLLHRQREALDEMQPASAQRVNPFEQDVNPAMVAYAGLAAFSNLGDPSGVFVGHIDPDFVPCYVDPFGAANRNKSPVFGVFGDPGSGKTFVAQLMAGQAAIAGLDVFFINPKPHDSLRPWVEWVAEQGAPARVVSLSQMEERGGVFDPFSFCNDGQMAAEILARHIMTCLGSALEPAQEFVLIEGLSNGARAGARCAMQALAYVADERIVSLVKGLASAHSLFRLAFSDEPRDDWSGSSGLTLIEFDRELPLPAPNKVNLELAERLAVATLRLTSRAAMEILMRNKGGVYVIDEAHHYIASPEGMASLDRLGREGRSMGLLPVFVTQRPSDLLSIDMESFIGRVLCMQLKDAAQATAALSLCLLEPTAGRIEFLRSAGPRQASEGVPGRPALGIMRDLDDRHAVLTVGPVPEHLRLAMSTNRADRQAREGQQQSAGPTTTEGRW